LIFIRLEILQTHQLNCSKNSLFFSFFLQKKNIFIFVFSLDSNSNFAREEIAGKENKERKFSLLLAKQTPKKDSKEN